MSPSESFLQHVTIRIENSIDPVLYVYSHFILTGYKKHDIPSLDDDVWRLKKISKDGALHDALRGSGILFVKDLLRLYHKDQQALRKVRQEFICVPSHLS
jgi:hypothetical protein